MKIYSQRRVTLSSAFTLIEILVVIAIITILAGLIVGVMPAAMKKSKLARIEGERDRLITIIDNYKAKKNFYPPDNTNNAVHNPLYYELAGTIQQNGNFVSRSQETLTPGDVGNLFGMGGFINTSADPSEVQNFLSPGQKNTQFAQVSDGASVPFTILGVPMDGPVVLKATDGSKQINPWRYVSSNPTNNANSYDLWMDVKIGGTVYRISNWSKDPQPL